MKEPFSAEKPSGKNEHNKRIRLIEIALISIGILLLIDTIILASFIIKEPLLIIQHTNQSCKQAIEEYKKNLIEFSVTPATEEEHTYEIDYDNLNYTVLNISREDYKSLSEFRQKAWLFGECYPSDCHMRNPPICTMVYSTYCYNPDNPTARYFEEQQLKSKTK